MSTNQERLKNTLTTNYNKNSIVLFFRTRGMISRRRETTTKRLHHVLQT